MSAKKRRKWTGGGKLRSLQPGVEISEVCRREGMNPTMFYTWRKKLMASAAQVFDEKPKKRDVERERMEREMSRMKDVIAEITAENLELKKRFRARRPWEDAAGIAAAGARGGGVDEASKRLAGEEDTGRVGDLGDELLPLAAGGGPSSWGRALRAA